MRRVVPSLCWMFLAGLAACTTPTMLDAGRSETGTMDAPGGDTPGSDTPGTDTPGADTPGGDTPGGDTPGADAMGGCPASCDDRNPCTADRCDGAARACVHDPDDSAGADDGDVCNGLETCRAGEILPGIALDCDDRVVCTTDACEPRGGCTHVANDRLCAASPGGRCDPSTGCQYDSCSAATCVPGSACETAMCVGATCTRTAVCMRGVLCCGGTCCPDDGNPCTTTSCGPDGRCVHMPNTAVCDDGNACTTGDRCSLASGNCVGTPISCRDSDPDDCTTFACVAGACTGSSLPTGARCDDGDPCTTTDICASGMCSGGAAPERTPCGPIDPRTCREPRCLSGSCISASLCTPGTSCCADGTCAPPGAC